MAAYPAGRLLLAGLFLLLLCGLAGCAFIAQRADWSGLGPERILIEDVPFFTQEQYQCGPAALAMVLNWSGLTARPEELVSEVYSPGLHGSLQPAMISAVRRHGRVAYPIAGAKTLTAELAAGHPVIVLVNLGLSWYPKWHYAVAVGYDPSEARIILHSGQTRHERLSLRVFDHLWARSDYWGLLVLPPFRLPATVEEQQWLKAAAGLELARQWPSAITAYETALNRWPASSGAWLGLGNSRYGAEDLAGAAAAFRQAAELAPQNGIPLNNLAQVLLEMGQTSEALVAARQAVERGGPLKEEFRRTLQQIETSPPSP